MIRLAFAALAVAAFVVSAAAQAPQSGPSYVPITIDETTYKGLHNYLGEQPGKFSTPLINWLNGEEAKAVSAKAAKEEPKTAPPAKQ
jgi:hypothetical protein